MSGLEGLNASAFWLGLTCVCALSNLLNAFTRNFIIFMNEAAGNRGTLVCNHPGNLW